MVGITKVVDFPKATGDSETKIKNTGNTQQIKQLLKEKIYQEFTKMPSHGKLVVPEGLKSLLEALGRAVVQDQPDNIHQFASSYFTELLQFRDGNPALDVSDLVKMFHLSRGIQEPEKQEDTASCPMLFPSKETPETSPTGETSETSPTGETPETSPTDKTTAEPESSCPMEKDSGKSPRSSQTEVKDKASEQQLPSIVDKGFKNVNGRIDELGTKMDGLIDSIKNLSDVMNKDQSGSQEEDEKQRRGAEPVRQEPKPKSPEPKTPEPKTPEPKTPEPKTPEPKTPEPKTPEPATPEPKTPEPKTPEPVTPETKTPETKTPEPEAEAEPEAE
ncbi:neurofilament medium polypeptide-like isoform X4 [Heptranchias perlo]|uniref:neurofilament medium polypeptide-like isoform X4 n=1 Tax=Heptranchias perlo TaxID=212740 RepID=UPI003559D855